MEHINAHDVNAESLLSVRCFLCFVASWPKARTIIALPHPAPLNGHTAQSGAPERHVYGRVVI